MATSLLAGSAILAPALRRAGKTAERCSPIDAALGSKLS